ncbi:MAG: microsomal dipeptidase-like Zn-dependent dipeptidase, partial [Limisphaerales bacterium]
MQLLRLIVLVCVLFSASSLFGQVVYEYMDLQTHPTMHVPYPFFSKGLQFFNEDEEPALSHKHQFNNVNYANYLLNNKGARIIIVGALTRETVKNPEAARKTILTQIEYVNNFVAENSENFAIAKTPAEVRLLVHNTEKTIIIHSIEGANKLINSQADANFWATQGVAFITLVHLIDSDHGSAAIKPNVFLKLINLKGSLRLKEKRGGLTAHGKNAIVWLANAGIMTDITHMSDLCRTEALEF